MATTALATMAVLLTLVMLLLLVPTLVLLVQVWSARQQVAVVAPEQASRPRLAVLMPAHNEAVGIAKAIQSVLPQLLPGDTLLVVADNCTDDTASVAAAEGAQVVRRHDAGRRGKGYALDHGVKQLRTSAPAVVVFVDADCTLGPLCLDTLARQCGQTGRPAQALYLMHNPPDGGLKTRLAELAWVVKNHVRPLGFAALGLPCQLMGTGMAFPWALIQAAPLASGHIVEDMQLGLDLAKAGKPPLFCPQALVSSLFPSETEGLTTQRTRWEHGHLAVIANQGPRLLWHALSRGQTQLLAMVLDLCVPPLAALALLLVAALVAAAALAALGGSTLTLWLGLLALAAFALSVLVAWQRFGRHIVSLRELLSVPGYVLSKLPVYAKAFTKRQTEWVRTKRDDGTR